MTTAVSPRTSRRAGAGAADGAAFLAFFLERWVFFFNDVVEALPPPPIALLDLASQAALNLSNIDAQAENRSIRVRPAVWVACDETIRLDLRSKKRM